MFTRVNSNNHVLRGCNHININAVGYTCSIYDIEYELI